jgi:cell division inhibitor SepF
MGVYLGLVEDDDFGDADGSYVHGVERGPANRDDYAESRYPRESGYQRGEVVNARSARDDDGYAYDDGPTYQITTLHPRTYNEARTIGEHFRKSTPVIMNLSEMDDQDAKRLVDFAAGLTFGLHGRIERVTAKVFLLSPHNVQVTAQDKARIAENGFFNQS